MQEAVVDLACPSATDSSRSTATFTSARSLCPNHRALDLFHAGNLASGVPYLLYHPWLHTVEEATFKCTSVACRWKRLS